MVYRSPEFLNVGQIIRLIGTTGDYLIESPQTLSTNCTFGSSGFRTTLLARRIKLRNKCAKEPCYVRFHLVNLDFLPIHLPATTLTNSESIDAPHIQFELDKLSIIIKKVEHYNEIIENLKVSKGVDITCEAVVPLAILSTLPKVEKRMNVLCALLTLAVGTLLWSRAAQD